MIPRLEKLEKFPYPACYKECVIAGKVGTSLSLDGVMKVAISVPKEEILMKISTDVVVEHQVAAHPLAVVPEMEEQLAMPGGSCCCSSSLFCCCCAAVVACEE